MTNYPSALDDDRTIIRIDDNLSELGTTAINQLREAVFSIEKTLGTNPQGSKTTLNERISVLINSDGTPNASTFSALGLVTLPISNNQISSSAGIAESKLNLDYTTSVLNTKIVDLTTTVNNITTTLEEVVLNVSQHTSGLSLRHQDNHIDLSVTLLDSNGDARSATNVGNALLEINNDLVGHENNLTNAHEAVAITVDASNFFEIPSDVSNVQETFEYLDQRENLSAGLDRATLSSNGILRQVRTDNLSGDGYNINIIPRTQVNVYLAEEDQTEPNDSIHNGDDVIEFVPTDDEIADFSFDEKFSRVCVGDVIRISYTLWDGYDGYSYVESESTITSINFVPGTSWVIRIRGYNLYYNVVGIAQYARIDKAKFNTETWGVFAAAGAYKDVLPSGPPGYDYPDSIILGNPRGAVAVGLGFDPSKLDSSHYNLYLRLYLDDTLLRYTDLAAIDVTGDAGASCGKYTIDKIVEATNRKFRSAGYNYRFIAFNQKGEFGIMLADHYNGACFAIVNGQVSGSTIIEQAGRKNVIGDAIDGFDALGLGMSRAGFASPISTGFTSAVAAANFPTFIIRPLKNKYAIINGTRKDLLDVHEYTQGDGYWLASVIAVDPSVPGNPFTTKTVTYRVSANLSTEQLKSGKTLVVQPSNPEDSSTIGYGRFIIHNVSYSSPCEAVPYTDITVVNGVHANISPTGLSSTVTDPYTIVRLYFTEDSVGINNTNVVGDVGVEYHRYHEIFVNNEGRSFDYERARMLWQTGTLQLLDTAKENWRIRKVSDKLIGYRDSTADFRYYVRLCLYNYNSTTGEFDGYIGQANGTYGLTNIGPIVHGKKDSTTRFYDNTFINYIDIEYLEDQLVSPGSTVCESDCRIIDIEIFPTLSTNKEFFIVAGVSHTVNRIKSITDLREFGTLSETNFTDSAISFIQSGERYLHGNGIVRGFEYEGIGTGVSSSVLSFTGGLALVNGAFVAIDSYNVKLPVVKSSVSDTVEYFICVTETGQLKAVVKDVGQQFFTVSGNYFIETLSFTEIVNIRKDLTIISKVVADYSGTFTVTSVTDARRFITNQDLGSFTWGIFDAVDGYNANFITEEALINWVNEYDIKQVKVNYVKLSSLIELNFTNYVELIGGHYNINSDIGIKFTNGNFSVKNAKVYYTPTTSIDSDDFFGLPNNYGAFVIENNSVTISNFSIENSQFYSTSTTRPPFISCFGTSNTFENGRFKNNVFNDTNALYSLAYAFLNTTTPSVSATTYPIFSNIIVEENTANSYQGLLISGRSNTSGTYEWANTQFPRIGNFTIKNNSIKLIAYSVKALTTSTKLYITGNTADFILSGVTATLNIHDYSPQSSERKYGWYYKASVINGSESIITDNKVVGIRLESNGSRSIVSNNSLLYISTASSDFYNKIISVGSLGDVKFKAISISYTGTLICSNNSIIGLESPIKVSCSSNGNIISGNSFINGLETIANPITIDSSSTGYGFITGNWCDISDRLDILTGDTLSHWIVSAENYGTFDFS